jgi:pimeloyl-ACP methyl ester carboxylesterase
MRKRAPEPLVTTAGAEGADVPSVQLRLAVDGGTLEGHRLGAGPALLLLHGGPGLSDYLAPLAAELAPDFTVVHYQQRGVPPSVTGGDRSVEGHVADVVAVLDDLGWRRPWVLGHSWGGHLAMHLAAMHPQRVAGLVVVDALGAVGDGGAEAFGENLMRPLAPKARARVAEITAREESGEVTVAEEVEALGLLWPFYFADPATASPMPPLEMDLEGHLATWASIREHHERGTLERALPDLRMPAVFIHGSMDPIPLEATRAGAALVPGSRLHVLPDVGHFPWLEQSGVMRELLRVAVSAAP